MVAGVNSLCTSTTNVSTSVHVNTAFKQTVDIKAVQRHSTTTVHTNRVRTLGNHPHTTTQRVYHTDEIATQRGHSNTEQYILHDHNVYNIAICPTLVCTTTPFDTAEISAYQDSSDRNTRAPTARSLVLVMLTTVVTR